MSLYSAIINKSDKDAYIVSAMMYGYRENVYFSDQLTNHETLQYLTTVFRNAGTEKGLGSRYSMRVALSNGQGSEFNILLSMENSNYIAIRFDEPFSDGKYYGVQFSGDVPKELKNALATIRRQ